MDEDRSLTIMVVRPGEGETRSISLSSRRLRALIVGVVAGVVLGGVILASWGYFAARHWRAVQLEREVAELRAEREQITELASALAETEAAYERIRNLFTPGALPEAGPGALPPPAAGSDPGASGAGAEGPTEWPLSQRGFITQPLVEGGDGSHPGIDVAVAAGSYIRAAGPGRVVEAADDPVYGLYVILEHGEGYRTLYAHASHIVVEPGDLVRPGEVLGLTGSTGRSTAPHLHFEILLDGRPVDPLTLVQQP